jgi:nucleoside-diphosphate-sugar epimerase
LLQAAGRAEVPRFVHISTPALYFNYRAQLGVKESFRPAAYVNHYARSKAEAEACVQNAVSAFQHMHCSILRPRAIFGPHDQVLLPRIARVLRHRDGRLPLPHGGRVTLDLTYAGNVVQAMWLATTVNGMPSGSVFNITNQEPVLLRDVLTTLFTDRLQWPFRIVNVPYPVMAAAARGMEALARITQKEPVLTGYSVGALAFDMTLDNSRAR